MEIKKKIEILAPAGSIDRMKAAFIAGADACYIGGSKFGARAFADNPSEEELISAIHYAHLHGKKLFLAVNTLLKEKELKEELYDYILPYYEAGIDAVIVQDFGVMRFLNKEFPDLPLHASTQMTLCDSTVIEELKKFNLERLVLSRELSLPEIARFKETGLEIECFVHGALCVCYSGQCSMSYFNGGRSGNRGSCAGPCRVDYNLYTEKKSKALKGEAYLLSPKDICSIDHIPEMVEAGIYSFKIEGRMKRAEYAALTSHLYRKWADYYLTYGKEAFHSTEAIRDRKKDIKDLSDLYNRGSFTPGYLFTHNGKEMMADKRPNHNGVLVGRVKKVGSPKKKNTMLIEALEKIHPQDVVEIRAANEVKPIYEFTLKEGYGVEALFSSNFTNGLNIKEGMEVYRTKNSLLLNKIQEELISSGLKREISILLKARISEELSLSFCSGDQRIQIKGIKVDEAKKGPVDKSRIIQALTKLGETDFFCKENKVDLQIDNNAFIPMSVLNEMRREAAILLKESIIETFTRRKPERMNDLFQPKVKKKEKVCYMIQISNSTQVEHILTHPFSNKTEIELCFNMDLFQRGALKKAVIQSFEKGFKTYLRLPEIFRHEISDKYEKYFQSENGKEVFRILNGFVIRNLEELVFIKNLMQENHLEKDLISDTNLHVFNSYAASTLYDFGIASYTVSLEHSSDEAYQTVKNLEVPIGVTVVVYGREEVMVTTQCQWKNKYKCIKELSAGEKALPDVLFLEQKRKGMNGKSALFLVAKNCESCNNYIFMETPLNYLKEEAFLKKIEPSRLKIDFTFETREEIREVLKLAKLS